MRPSRTVRRGNSSTVPRTSETCRLMQPRICWVPLTSLSASAFVLLPLPPRERAGVRVPTFQTWVRRVCLSARAAVPLIGLSASAPRSNECHALVHFVKFITSHAGMIGHFHRNDSPEFQEDRRRARGLRREETRLVALGLPSESGRLAVRIWAPALRSKRCLRSHLNPSRVPRVGTPTWGLD